jgi:hypothetical protein
LLLSFILHQNNNNIRYLHTVVNEEIRRVEIATKRQSLKVDDEVIAELLPQLVAEEVRVLEQELKRGIIHVGMRMWKIECARCAR